MGWFSKSSEPTPPSPPPSARPTPPPPEHAASPPRPDAPPSAASSPSTAPTKPLEPAASGLAPPAEDTRPATVVDAVRTIRPADFTSFHKAPCARESLLTGLGAGFGVGGIRLVFGGTAWTSMSYFVGSFALGAAGTHAFCRRRRQLEKVAVARANEIMQRKGEERKALAAAKRREMEERRERREKHEREKKGWMRWRGGDAET